MYPPCTFKQTQTERNRINSGPETLAAAIQAEVSSMDSQGGAAEKPLLSPGSGNSCWGTRKSAGAMHTCLQSQFQRPVNVCAVSLLVPFHQLLALVRSHSFFGKLASGVQDVVVAPPADSSAEELKILTILDTLAAAVCYVRNLQAWVALQRFNTPADTLDLLLPDAEATGAGRRRPASPISAAHLDSSSQDSGNISINTKRDLRETSDTLQSRSCTYCPDRSILEDWFFKHFDHPYPSEREKCELAFRSGLTLRQVNDYFANKRVRCRRRAETLRRRAVPPSSPPGVMQKSWSVPLGRDVAVDFSRRGAVWRARVLPYAKHLLSRETF